VCSIKNPLKAGCCGICWQSSQEENMNYDPIQMGAMLAFIINAWLASRKK
jgi:hypothetical protein